MLDQLSKEQKVYRGSRMVRVEKMQVLKCWYFLQIAVENWDMAVLE